jgi:hypothetical protein
MGVVKKSLHTWQRREDSRGATAERGVASQSVLSVTVVVSILGYGGEEVAGNEMGGRLGVNGSVGSWRQNRERDALTKSVTGSILGLGYRDEEGDER